MKYTCGNIFPSGCIIYTGRVPTFGDQDLFECDPRLDDIVDAIIEEVETILVGIDLTDIDPKCYEFDTRNVTIKEFVQETIDTVCNHETRIETLEGQLEDLDISDLEIEIDLDCLTPLAAPCEQGTNTYTLLSLLSLFKSEICAIKDYLNI